MLHGPLIDSGCTYTSYFTSMVTLEVKAEQSSDLRVEWSSEMGAERSSDSKSGAGQSSDLGVGWNLEQQKCEMGCPLTVMPIKIHGRDVNVMLKDTLYAPDIAFTLISIGKCDDAGYQTVFAQQKCIVKDSNGKILFEVPKFHGLYQLDHELAQAMACPCLPAAEIHR